MFEFVEASPRRNIIYYYIFKWLLSVLAIFSLIFSGSPSEMIFLFLIQSIFAGTFTQVTKTVVIPFKLSANLVLLHEVPIPGLELKGQIFTRGTFHEIQPNLSCVN